MSNYKRWKDVELEFIKNNYKIISDEELAVKLSQLSNENITTPMIRRQRRKLSLAKEKGRPSTKSKTESLKEMAHETDN